MANLLRWRAAALGVTLVAGAMAAQAGDLNPAADPRAVVAAGQARFTVLTPALVRIEWSADRTFENRASFTFVNRRLPVPAFSVTREGGRLVIETIDLTIRYKEHSGPFNKDNLSIELNLSGSPVTWHPGKRDTGNLGGTIRTLDSVEGATPLDPGLLSRNGWTLVDDSKNLLFDSSDWAWATARAPSGAIDWYFFGYGRDYKRQLKDYTGVAGRIPMPPKFVFGSWWSRYWDYTDSEFKSLVREFRDHDVPLDVLVIDMDWHLDGWTGYTWNPKSFPDAKRFLQWAHDEDLRTTLNLHPADGAGRHESRFPEMARAMGLDPATTDRVPFDCTDRKFVDAYFKVLHHPLEREGVDFWWIDWQQGSKTKIEGLDPLWWLNYLHWTDMERRAVREGKRPLILSRWGGLGNHRYQIGFSGDVHSTWQSLAFQPYFTATAGNVGYPYWSHDIGGHQPGPVEPEMYARWVQWGAFSPVLRTHGTKNPKAERRIWAFPKDVFESARDAFHLRYEILPYLYTAARNAYDEGLPLCRPLYYEWPEWDEAYARTDEYMFGDDLLVAPVAVPANPVTRCADVSVWIPPGEWTNWFSGRTYVGPADVDLQVPLDEMPIFVRGGGVIAAMPKMRSTSEKAVDPLILNIFPGDSGTAVIYEDDGAGVGYQRGECAWTPVHHRRADGRRVISIGAVTRSYPGQLKRRSYEVRLRDVWPPAQVLMNGKPLAPSATGARAGWWYDTATLSCVIRVPSRPVRSRTDLLVVSHEGNEDESALRKGLRGRLALLDEAADMLGTRRPGEIERGRRVRDRLRTDAANARTEAESVLRDWPNAVASVSALRLDPGLQDRLLTRLMGVSSRLRLEATGDGNRILASIEPLFAFPRSDYDFSRVMFRIESTPRWKLERTDDRMRVTGGRSAMVSDVNVFKPARAPQTDVIRAHVALSAQKTPFAFRLESPILPSIHAWRVIGPFDAPFETALDAVFPPERRLRFGAAYPGKGGDKVLWQKVERTLRKGDDLTKEFFVDLHHVFGRHHNNAVAYAYTELRATRDTDAVLAIGSDDAVAVWLNGREVHRLQVGRPYVSKQDRVPVRLRKGKNTLLLKITQGGGEWGFCVHVETPDGKPMPEVETR